MKTKQLPLCIAMTIMLTACGGGGGGDAGAGGGNAVTAAEGPQSGPQPARPRFANQVTFGDALSDVGTYAVAAIAQAGGGKYTINGDATTLYPALTGKLWNETIAAQLRLPAPCAVVTGLQGDTNRGLSAESTYRAGCFNYAQGGARVTDPIGPGNVATGAPLGALTTPVAAQVAAHLAAVGGGFQGNELVLVMAGTSDVVTQWMQLAQGADAAAQAAGPDGAAQARSAYLAANGPVAVAAVSAAANDLVTLVRQRILGTGAHYVLVNNVPDLSVTPLATSQDPALRAQVQALAAAFNQVLKAGLDPEPSVVQVDVFALSQDEVANPAAYGLANTTGPACGPNALGGSALVCAVWNTVPVDVSHFLFADTLYPTPYGHALIARRVAEAMATRGWL